MAEGQSNLVDGRHKVASANDIYLNLEKEIMEKHNLNPTKKIKFQVYSKSNSFKSSNKIMKIARYTIFKKENRKSPYNNPLRVLYPRPSATDENAVSSSDDTVVMDFPIRFPRVANNNAKMDEGEKAPLNTDSSDGVDGRDPHPLPSYMGKPGSSHFRDPPLISEESPLKSEAVLIKSLDFWDR